jgi:hypothetical protein
MKQSELSDPEVAASILRLSERGPTPKTSHASHWKKLCSDESDPTEVQAALAASAVVSDVMAN